MAEPTSAASEALRAGNRVVLWGIAAIVAILALAAILLFLSLPDANAFNARVERIFVENDALTTGEQIKLLCRQWIARTLRPVRSAFRAASGRTAVS